MANLSLLVFFALIVGQSSLVQAACKVPPQFWCDDLETSTACGVTKQCEAIGQSKAKLVEVGLYYESLCPGCRYFIQHQLTPAFKKIGSILNITLVPYGNARTSKSSVPGGYSFQCQHGPEECVGNMIETCALYLYKDPSVNYPFISCVEASSELPKRSAEKCAKLHKVDYTKIMGCVNSPTGLGVKLEYQMGVRTNNLRPQHQYTPWITLNGVHTNRIQNEAESDLVKLVCSTYTGSPKPQACTESSHFDRSARN